MARFTAAHVLAGEFPDGHVAVDLGSPARTPDDVIASVLHGLGVSGSAVPGSRAAQYRSLVAGRQVLVLLDNASSTAQIRPFVAAAGAALLVTTTRPLRTLDRAVHLELPPLDRDASARLLTAHAGHARLAADPAG